MEAGPAARLPGANGPLTGRRRVSGAEASPRGGRAAAGPAAGAAYLGPRPGLLGRPAPATTNGRRRRRRRRGRARTDWGGPGDLSGARRGDGRPCEIRLGGTRRACAEAEAGPRFSPEAKAGVARPALQDLAWKPFAAGSVESARRQTRACTLRGPRPWSAKRSGARSVWRAFRRQTWFKAPRPLPATPPWDFPSTTVRVQPVLLSSVCLSTSVLATPCPDYSGGRVCLPDHVCVSRCLQIWCQLKRELQKTVLVYHPSRGRGHFPPHRECGRTNSILWAVGLAEFPAVAEVAGTWWWQPASSRLA
ncbi:uncharacterized protein LOC119515341 [Choloepus didactylus]|uniref:uncharacterized protein LOC119515341 n=1 Tax=Choloepus didactylus TaxID=27675 RepID=UPI00189D6462|nr:uncharacterized protein LOC119515341 [Choloepus didactylus]